MWWSSENSNKTLDMDMIDIHHIMKERREPINSLKQYLKDDLDQISNFQLKDNFFLLRYILSFKNDIEKAAVAIRKALLWRKKNHEFVKRAMKSDHTSRNFIFPEHLKPYVRAIKKYLSASGHKSTINGQPVVICRIEACNFNALSQIVPQTIMQDYILFSNEIEFWECDRLSRVSGKLHKAFRLIDLKHLSLKSLDRVFLNAFSESSNVSEFLHPQLVGKTILINPPSVLRLILEIIKRLGVSRRALEKIYSCKSPSNGTGPNQEVLSIIYSKDLPVFLGGTCNCPDGCLPDARELASTSKSNDTHMSHEIDLEKEHVNSFRSSDSDSEQLLEEDLKNSFPEISGEVFALDFDKESPDHFNHTTKSNNLSG